MINGKNPPQIIVDEFDFAAFAMNGHLSLSERTRQFLNDLSAPKTCLSCGARQSDDGTLPCDH